MESSIPAHLTVERTCPRRKSDAFPPPYPSFSARFDAGVDQVVMAYFGVQHQDSQLTDEVDVAVRALLGWTRDPAGPDHTDRARFVDEAGFTTILTTLYWTDTATFDEWSGAHPPWTAQARQGVGFFLEVVQPTVQRYETLFSNDRVEGVSVAAVGGLSGEIQEHGYWGGARDRLPAAQTDRLEPSGACQVVPDGDVVRVVPHENVCLIRSGQEWSETDGDERRMYLEDVEPVLRAGMDFLRDDGLSVGCYANRYVRVVGEDGTELDKSWGMSWWRSLEDLETWSESHPTHVAIFQAALKYLSTMGPAAHLRLYHEVTVATAAQQSFEYAGCHDRTGMLRAALLLV